MRVPDWISTPRTTTAGIVRGSGDGEVGPHVGPDGVSGGLTGRMVERPPDRAGDGPSDGGPAGNARLTAATGMVLLVLLAVEGVTVLGVRQMLTMHVVVGALLIGPVMLKSGSTVYRFARYYGGAEPYRRKGPPPLPLRLIGPPVILATVALLCTGIALVFTGPTGSGLLLTAHQTSFWVWFGLMSVHVLGHVWEAAVLSWRDLRSSWRGPGARRRWWRLSAIVLALMVGVAAATALVPSAAPWTSRTARPAPQVSRPFVPPP